MQLFACLCYLHFLFAVFHDLSQKKRRKWSFSSAGSTVLWTICLSLISQQVRDGPRVEVSWCTLKVCRVRQLIRSQSAVQFVEEIERRSDIWSDFIRNYQHVSNREQISADSPAAGTSSRAGSKSNKWLTGFILTWNPCVRACLSFPWVCLQAVCLLRNTEAAHQQKHTQMSRGQGTHSLTHTLVHTLSREMTSGSSKGFLSQVLYLTSVFSSRKVGVGGGGGSGCYVITLSNHLRSRSVWMLRVKTDTRILVYGRIPDLRGHSHWLFSCSH